MQLVDLVKYSVQIDARSFFELISLASLALYATSAFSIFQIYLPASHLPTTGTRAEVRRYRDVLYLLKHSRVFVSHVLRYHRFARRSESSGADRAPRGARPRPPCRRAPRPTRMAITDSTRCHPPATISICVTLSIACPRSIWRNTHGVTWIRRRQTHPSLRVVGLSRFEPC